MKEKFEASEEEKRLRSMMRQYEAPDMTALQEQKLWVLLRELEQSCCFHLRKLMAAKMAVMGIVDGVFLIFLMAAVGNRGSGLSGAVLAVLVPFLLSNAVYLWLFRVLKRHCSGYVLTAAGICMAGGMLMLKQYLPDLPSAVSSGAAAAIGTAGFVLLLVSGYGVLKQVDREETVVWNCV